jgi:hypothetical protein
MKQNKNFIKLVLFAGLVLSAGSALSRPQFDTPLPIPCGPGPCSAVQGLR